MNANSQTGNVTVEFDEAIGEFIAYRKGDDQHTGYGATVQDAIDSLAWNVENE